MRLQKTTVDNSVKHLPKEFKSQGPKPNTSKYTSHASITDSTITYKVTSPQTQTKILKNYQEKNLGSLNK